MYLHFSDEVICHITQQQYGTLPSKKYVRFSLYLSSQLMYGLTRVYNKQTTYLLSKSIVVSSIVFLILYHQLDFEQEYNLLGQGFAKFLGEI